MHLEPVHVDELAITHLDGLLLIIFDEKQPPKFITVSPPVLTR